jgi:hypothetical protein
LALVIRDLATGEGLVDNPWTNDPIRVNTLVKKMTSGGKKHAPGLVILNGCRSCEMADRFLASGSGCVLCFHLEMDASDLFALSKDFMTSACRNPNGSLGRVFDDVATRNQVVLERYASQMQTAGIKPDPAKGITGRHAMELICLPRKGRGKSLNQILGKGKKQ